MKKLVSCLLIVCICSALCTVTGFGESSGLSDKVYSTLVGYEIITADEAENSGQVLTRREAAKTLILLLGMENVFDLSIEQSPFLDVPADDEYAPYIFMGSELGILSGDGNGFFRPEDTLSQEEAAKILVSCLGYDSEAEKMGGYPTGYMAEAQRLLLFRGANLSDEFTKADFYTMVYQTMQTKRLLPDYGEDGNVYLDERTFGEQLKEQKEFVTGEGIVAGNVKYSLYEDITVGVRHVLIGSEKFLLGEISLPEILGQKVTYYAYPTQSGEYELKYVFKDSRTQELKLARSQDAFWQTGKIGYYDESGKERTADLEEECTYIYNGRPAELPTEGEINGEVLLVSYEGSSSYALVIVTETETRRVSYIKPEQGVMHFKREAWYAADEVSSGLKELTEEDKERVILLENSNGEAITLADIAVDDVVTVAVSSDCKHVYIRKEENRIQGSVTEFGTETIGIDGTNYMVAKEFEGKNPFGIERTGTEGDFYLNEEEEIIYFVKDTGIEKNYGYIADIAVGGAFSSEIMLNLVIPGRIQYFEESHDDGSTDRYLKAANEAIETHFLKEELNVDGQKKEAAELVENGALKKGMVISYEENAEGMIHRITLPVAYYDADARSSLRKFVTFSDSKAVNEEDKTVFAFSALNRGGFKVSSEGTAVFCVPPLPGEEQTITGDPNYSISNDDDYFDNITMNNGTSYYTRAYDFEEETSTVSVFMIVSGLNANRSDDVLQNEPWSILQSKSVKLNEDGEVVYSLNVYSEGKSFRIESMPYDANGQSRQLEDLIPGDVFKFTENTQGKIFEISPRQDIFSIAADIPANGEGFYSRETGNLFGKVSKIQRKIIDETTTQYAHLIDVDYGDGIQSVTASYTDTGIYIYDTQKETVEVGTEEDIYSYEETGIEGDGTQIFAKVDTSGNAQIIVIIDD